MPKVDVGMDDGGAIRQKGSKDVLETGMFGGCTAIYAYTDNGLYGLYHLRSALDAKAEVVPDAADSNEPYRKWIADLKAQAKEDTIHFWIGTPSDNANPNDLFKFHPEVGMERYLRKLCYDNQIQSFDIKLLNMAGVNQIKVSDKGMACESSDGKPMQIGLAQYQTDEDIFEHSGYTTEQCLNNIRGFPNIDYDGALAEKYEKRLAKEQLVLKQKAMKEKLQVLENEKVARIKHIHNKLLAEVNTALNTYQQQFNNSEKGDKTAADNFIFAKALQQAVVTSDPQLLASLKLNENFEQITEVQSILSIFVGHDKTELGQLFDKVESQFALIESIENEDLSSQVEQNNSMTMHQ